MGSNTSTTMDLKTLRPPDETSKDSAPTTGNSSFYKGNGHHASLSSRNASIVSGMGSTTTTVASSFNSRNLKGSVSPHLPSSANNMLVITTDSASMHHSSSPNIQTSSALHYNHSNIHDVQSPTSIEDDTTDSSDEDCEYHHHGFSDSSTTESLRHDHHSSCSHHQVYSVLKEEELDQDWSGHHHSTTTSLLSASRSFLLQKRLSHHQIQPQLVQATSDTEYFSQQPPTSRLSNGLIDIQESVIVLNKRSCGSLKHMKSTSSLLGSLSTKTNSIHSHDSSHQLSSQNCHHANISSLNSRMERRKSTTDISPNNQNGVTSKIKPMLHSSALEDTIVINCNERSVKRNRSPSPLSFNQSFL
ncbi:hypothetical protein C9374_004994 [Naegleria lovaniensis]|uniref:Uncharacterized protein n=1 Tax=Naegleria lovaniensis TaxID=51637 RepID=A0AA88KJ88_NAELO|nr:uncharacterized protein C9374_004994 [Naegleria lovaniensis]KAG2383027.1 hypothetical protein C9374_004994 [Naegleria lovaniensis]